METNELPIEKYFEDLKADWIKNMVEMGAERIRLPDFDMDSDMDRDRVDRPLKYHIQLRIVLSTDETNMRRIAMQNNLYKHYNGNVQFEACSFDECVWYCTVLLDRPWSQGDTDFLESMAQEDVIVSAGSDEIKVGRGV